MFGILWILLKAFIVKAASRWGRTGAQLNLQLIDVSRAHFYAQAVRDVFIQLPDEDPDAANGDLVGKLDRTMYGTLDAAERWAEHYSQILVQAGFRRGTASPCHF